MRNTKGLYKRGQMYWMAFRVNGKLYRESAGVKSQKEAEYVLAKRRKEISEGEWSDTKLINCKFAELAKDYEKWTERQRIHETKKIWISQ